MERSQGFTIPENKCFYVVSFEDLAYYNLNTDEVIEIENWELDENRRVIILKDIEIPFIGLWGGNPVLQKDGVGNLLLSDSEVTLLKEDGSKKIWKFENFSGDREYVTFDTKINGFLYGAPYDFDYRYITIT